MELKRLRGLSARTVWQLFAATMTPVVDYASNVWMHAYKDRLVGPIADMFEMHGGCGFSKRLLHIFSQVAYCSTRMLQDGKTPVVPVTAEFLYDQLMKMHQWSTEYESWNAAKSRHQPIECIPQTVKSYVV